MACFLIPQLKCQRMMCCFSRRQCCCLCVCVCVSVCLFVCPSVCLSVWLAVSLRVYVLPSRHDAAAPTPALLPDGNGEISLQEFLRFFAPKPSPSAEASPLPAASCPPMPDTQVGGGLSSVHSGACKVIAVCSAVLDGGLARRNSPQSRCGAKGGALISFLARCLGRVGQGVTREAEARDGLSAALNTASSNLLMSLEAQQRYLRRIEETKAEVKEQKALFQ
jgi:hypothetical protein